MRLADLRAHGTDRRKRLLTYECDCGERVVVIATRLGLP